MISNHGVCCSACWSFLLLAILLPAGRDGATTTTTSAFLLDAKGGVGPVPCRSTPCKTAAATNRINNWPGSRRLRSSMILKGVAEQQHETSSLAAAAVVAKSAVLGDLYRIRMEGEEDGFVSAMDVPTFACRGGSEEDSNNNNNNNPTQKQQQQQRRGLEGVLNQGPAFVIDDVLSNEQCQDIMAACDQAGFADYQAGKNHHGALQLLVASSTADAVAHKLARHVDLEQVEERRRESEDNIDAAGAFEYELSFSGLNRRWRVYKYAPDCEQTFAPHIDAGFPPSGLNDDGTTLLWDSTAINDDKDDESTATIVSRLTVLVYLNDNFVGGETNFYAPLAEQQDETQDKLQHPIASVRPRQGSCLVFPQGVGEDAVEYARRHWPLHEGAPVRSGSSKYVIRSDVLFRCERRPLLRDDPLFRYDSVVRQTMAPQQCGVLDRNFLGLLKQTYEPHMGVENLGPLLYSFVRFTKKRRIVEIGAGYTTPWILQALADNDAEMKRIKMLKDEGKARLLDYPWVNDEQVDKYWEQPAVLQCIDNCQHQKETATGAVAVAQQLGLGPYLDFIAGDAFELMTPSCLKPNSIDILWCDFGVGSRMKDFVSGAWKALRPGGFLLCHSTLTNQRSRDWLEAVRARQSQIVTGIPPEEIVEVSLLEPHKHYQNSLSVLQKRRDYSEPLYSEYA